MCIFFVLFSAIAFVPRCELTNHRLNRFSTWLLSANTHDFDVLSTWTLHVPVMVYNVCNIFFARCTTKRQTNPPKIALHLD